MRTVAFLALGLLPAAAPQPRADERHAEVTVLVAACYGYGPDDERPAVYIVRNSRGREYSLLPSDFDMVQRLADQTQRLVIAGAKDGLDLDYDQGNAHKLRRVRVVTFTPR